MFLASYHRAMIVLLVLLVYDFANAHPYNESLTDYNININRTAGNDVLSYASDWPEKRTSGYTPSPTNWRALPTYTVLLDKFVDGNPMNNDYFETRFEWDLTANQLRHGGDIMGFAQDRVLDYIHGMGYRVIYIAGTPWVNMPWQADGYSALDFTLLDPHYGTLTEWRSAIEKIHAKGMYVMLDMTTTTMGDLIGVKEFLNSSAPFNLQGYEVLYKKPPFSPWGLDEYADFNFTNTRTKDCKLPDFYDTDGSLMTSLGEKPDGCYTGDFDQYGDVEAFGVHPDWQRQLSKFASVQDRLREWDDSVAVKLEHLACMTIQALDLDSLRIDKATQQTVDFVGKWGKAVKTCAKTLGKNNFFTPGEITGGNTLGSLYVGRGRQPQHYKNLGFQNASQVKANESQYFLRPVGYNGLDSAAFHYSVYRSLTRFLSMDGNLDVAYDVQVNWITAWNEIFVSNDFLNHDTGLIDPRHLYGTSNQDVFRWPSLTNGTQKFLLGQLVTNLIMPGIPLAFYGEEQAMYIYDSQASNYLYGRQAMSATRAWQTHGCYRVGSKQYSNMEFDKALTGCKDEWNSLDHFDPTSGVRNVLNHFTYLRSQYAALQDGFSLFQRGNWTSYGQLPGSNITQTEWGLWSISRGGMDGEKLVGLNPNVTVWMIYSNLNESRTFTYGCSTALSISAPYPSPATVRNLMYPYETYNLTASQSPYYLDGKAPYRGCLPSITMEPLGFKVLVPTPDWISPLPRLVSFQPGHDARILSLPNDDNHTIALSLGFSDEMSCSGVSSALTLTYTIDPASTTRPQLDIGSAKCTSTPPVFSTIEYAPSAVWTWSSSISNAVDGIYHITINNATNQAGIRTLTTDHLLIRKGEADNPITFPKVTYSKTVLQKGTNGEMKIVSNAAGADLMRYSTDFGQTYSKWQTYSKEFALPSDAYSATRFWEGNHIRAQYYSQVAGSSAQAVDSDYGMKDDIPRRVPQLLVRGPYNHWGYDKGVSNKFSKKNGNWTFDLMAAWPDYFQVTVFDTQERVSYGDVDEDGAMDLLPPNAQSPNYLHLSRPRSPYLGWRMIVNQTDMTWSAVPIGHKINSIILFILLATIPPITALLACLIFRTVFYSIKKNKYGFRGKSGFALLSLFASTRQNLSNFRKAKSVKKGLTAGIGAAMGLKRRTGARWPEDMTVRRKVLIATLEYEITDWKLKVKIGGLGVMSSLMGKAMHDVDLLWVIPKVKDLEYPQAEPAPPIEVTIFAEKYLIECQSHQVDNITYFLLDSPIFRASTKADPYPARMDDLSSAIFYSSWNQCIAQICRQTPDLDIYHINDYHGALAPLYLLPAVLPVSLSLHNAEFQGLWPLRTKEEANEVCKAFNLSPEVCTKYIQFGNVFNLLHAAASFISYHQSSVGVAGVSEAYGKRSWSRYPALWTLKTIDSLPNPDPSDIEALDLVPKKMKKVKIDAEAESKRPEDKRRTQEWAGLVQDPNAQLFVFVGRWSLQKGVDLIADVFTGILEERPDIQLVAVGPVVDLYGRFAAAKLKRLMELYPDRVFSKPEFTILPSFIFSGGDFALIPSRDEPFGLVAVEFGRKGALGVGSRLGGLGLMPGWWFPVESDSTSHMHSQFSKTIKAALKSTNKERAILRARSALQRFPVLEWRTRIENMHRRSINASRKCSGKLAAGSNAGLDLAHSNGSSIGLSWITPRTEPISASASTLPSFSPGRPAADNSYGLAPRGSSQRADFSPLQHSEFPASSNENDHDDDPLTSQLLPPNSPYNDSYRPYAEGGLDSPSNNRLNAVEVSGANDEAMEINRISVVSSEDSAEYVEDEGDLVGSFLTQANTQINRTLTRRLTHIHGIQATQDPFHPSDAPISETASPLDLPHDSTLGASLQPIADNRLSGASFGSINSIMEEHGGDSPLNKAIEDFTDENGEVAQEFITKLAKLSSDNSKGDLCIAEYLVAAEKAHFRHVRDDKIAQARSHHDDASATPRTASRRPFSHVGHIPNIHQTESDPTIYQHSDASDQALNTTPELSQWQIRLQYVFYGWPLYAVLLAFGQVLSATSLQLSLLGGTSSQKTFDLYIIGSVNIVGSVCWYVLNYTKPAAWSLSLPWVFFGIGFIFVGIPSFAESFKDYTVRHPLSLVASSFYSFASSAGFLFFSTNFGEEAGGATNVWVFRACVVQGTQQIWVAALWYWGFKLQGTDPSSTSSVPPAWINAVTMTLGLGCFFISYILFRGLPTYYRNVPGHVPNFVKTLARRKVVLRYLVSEVLRNYWLSGPYGQNWTFLWTNPGIPVWVTVILVVLFFVGVWAATMWVLSHFSKRHTWLLPVFAMGLGAPRWCQILWGTSGAALYIPWAGGAGPYFGTSLWLWLGVLDAIQGVGLGMILLQTLSRVHVAATLCMAQIIGSTTVLVARATAPDRIGPANVFPNLALYDPHEPIKGSVLGHWEFWVALACQLIIVVGYSFFFRREQLSKP